MHKKKLITILASFSKTERKECYNYLSAHLKESTDEFRLFKYIAKLKDDFTSKKLEIKTVRDRVKPGLSLQKFQNLMSALVGRIEKFIIAYEGDSPQLKLENQLRLGAFYKKKGLYPYFKQVHRKIATISEELPKLGTEYQQLKMQQQHQLFFSKLKVKNEIDLLLDTWEALERFYQQKRLVYEIEVANQQHLLNRVISPPVPTFNLPFDIILQHQKKMINYENNADQDKHFSFLENYLINQYDEFSPESAYRLLNYLLNAYLLKIKKKERVYINKISTLYDFGITSKCLLYNGKLTAMSFLNIIDVWSNSSENTTQKSLEIIPKSVKYVNYYNHEVLQSVAWIIYHFAIGNFAESLTLSSTAINQKELVFSTRANLIRLASFYCCYPDYLNKEEIINSTTRFFKKIEKRMSKENYLAFTNTIEIIQMLWTKQPLAFILAFEHKCEHLFLQTWIDKTLNKQ